MERRSVLILGASSIVIGACAPSITRSAKSKGVGMSIVPPRDSLFIVLGSTSSNSASAAGENDAVAQRIRGAFAGALDSFSEMLVTDLRRQFASRAVPASIEAYSTADPNFSMRQSYASAPVEQILECTPIYRFARERSVAIGVRARQVDVKSNAMFATLFSFGYISVVGTESTSRKELGPALLTEQDWFPSPGDTQSLAKRILELVPRFATGIVEHFVIRA